MKNGRKFSIKTKLFLGIILILSLFFLGILTYSLTFKGFFMREKLIEMKGGLMEIETLLREESLTVVNDYIYNMAENYNLQIEIFSLDEDKVVCGTHGGSRRGNSMGQMNRFIITEDLGEEEGIKKHIVFDKSSTLSFLQTTYLPKDMNYEISIKTPISAIEDSVNKSIKLLLIILCPLTLLILFITILFAKAFTSPIIKITEKTSRILNLDFKDRLDISLKDEVGDLALSVNNLSNKIEKTLLQLTEKNQELEGYIWKEKENEILRKEFVSSVSHELKTPITIISGYSESLNSGIIKGEEDRKYYLDVIFEESQRMEIIVNDLLDLYKLESNTFKLKKESIDLKDFMEKILGKLDFKFKELGVNLKVSLDYEGVIIGDRVRLEQAIVNYINNGLSHMDNRKIIRISTEVVEDKVKISVINSGKPIPSDAMDKIWQGFVRLDEVRNYGEKRVGLGLAIVSEIVRLHGGERGLRNMEGEVEFWIKVPRN